MFTNLEPQNPARLFGASTKETNTMKTRIKIILTLGLALALPQLAAAAESTHQADALENLIAIQKSLAADSMGHVTHHAAAIAKAATDHKINGLSQQAAKQAHAVANAKDIKAAREAFKKLNESFEAYLKDHPDKSGKYHVAYCPMAKASWVQTGNTIANPYFGQSMLTCGTFTH